MEFLDIHFISAARLYAYSCNLKIPSYPIFKEPDARTFLLQASSVALGTKRLEENR